MTTGVKHTGFVLQSASFAQVKPPQITASDMLVRALTRVFHTCGKNCGNSPVNDTVAQFPGGFPVIRAIAIKRRFTETCSGRSEI